MYWSNVPYYFFPWIMQKYVIFFQSAIYNDQKMIISCVWRLLSIRLERARSTAQHSIWGLRSVADRQQSPTSYRCKHQTHTKDSGLIHSNCCRSFLHHKQCHDPSTALGHNDVPPFLPTTSSYSCRHCNWYLPDNESRHSISVHCHKL